MKEHEVIIVGGGPAGASCAWKLRQHGRDVLVLERQVFPRTKLCAGWITSKVMKDLEYSSGDYPHSMLHLDVRIHLPFIPVGLPYFPTKWDNYSIRRIEFDQWLLDRAEVPVSNHHVRRICEQGGGYLIDDLYACRYLVGAGGTQCPVRKCIFPGDRIPTKQLATLELEFEYPQRRDQCHLFFFAHRLPGYSWYVPKGDGIVNIGIGGKSNYFKKPGNNIHDHFKWFLDELVKQKLMDRKTANHAKVTGHPYFLFSFAGEYKRRQCFLIGDSAGLASVDLGEGIGPAIESGLMAAEEILGTGSYVRTRTSRFSLGGTFNWLLDRVIYPTPRALRG